MRTLSSEFTDEEMINALKEFTKANGRSPKMKDFKGKNPSDSMIAKRFGKWSSALKLAGLKQALRPNDYTREDLLGFLKKFYSDNRKAPTSRDMIYSKQGTFDAYRNHFGSFKNALIEAGLFELRTDKHQFCPQEYTDEGLLEALKEYMKDKNRIPVHSVMKKELNPGISTYERRFHSIFNALKLIGYDYDEQNVQDLINLENDMITKYKELREALKRTPSSRDIEKYNRLGECYAMKTYERHFGSLYELQVICGFTPTVVGRNKSRKDLIEDLKMMAEELEKTPSQLDIRYFDNVASTRKYTDVFGSWVIAIKEAGLKPTSKIYYSIKGTKCLSYYELLFTNMLETFGMDFEKETPYRDYMDIDRKFRFDYIITINNHKYFVEIFGMTDNKDYEERIKYKALLCKENNLNLIEVYPKDFNSYKLEDLHRMFLNKL